MRLKWTSASTHPTENGRDRLSRPTVNCFLYDVRENHDLRRADFETNRTTSTSIKRKPPLRIDATYQITVWARVPEDEHRLLWRVLVALCRFATIPIDLLQDDLRNQPMPVPARVAQPDQMPQNYADLWQSLDNRIRPSLTYVVTIALDPDVVFSGPLVFTRTIRVQNQVSGEMSESFEIGGHVFQSETDFSGVVGATVILRETGDQTTTDSAGRFVFSRAPSGPITLVVRADEHSEGDSRDTGTRLEATRRRAGRIETAACRENSETTWRPPTDTADLHAALQRVDIRLQLAVASFRDELNERARDPFRGLYISNTDIDTLLASAPVGSAVTGLLATPVASFIPRLALLARQFGLDAFDQEVLLICLAPEIDPRYERLFGYLHDDVTRRRPSIDLVARILESDVEERVAIRQRFGPHSSLMRFDLLRFIDDATQSPPDDPWTPDRRADRRLPAWIKRSGRAIVDVRED